MKKIIKSVLAILLLAIVTMFSTLAIKESNIVARKNVCNGQSASEVFCYTVFDLKEFFKHYKIPSLPHPESHKNIPKPADNPASESELMDLKNKILVLFNNDEEKMNAFLREKGYHEKEKELENKHNLLKEEILKNLKELEKLYKEEYIVDFAGTNPELRHYCNLSNQIFNNIAKYYEDNNNFKKLYKEELETATTEKINELEEKNKKTEESGKTERVEKLKEEKDKIVTVKEERKNTEVKRNTLPYAGSKIDLVMLLIPAIIVYLTIIRRKGRNKNQIGI